MVDGGAVVGLGIFGAKLGGLVLFEFWTGEGRGWNRWRCWGALRRGG